MSRPYPTLKLDGEFPFGKYKGTLISKVIEDDPDYLLWLRRERSNGALQVNGATDDLGFSEEVHALLNVYLAANPKLTSKYGYKPHVTAKITALVAEEDRLAEERVIDPATMPETWGAW